MSRKGRKQGNVLFSDALNTFIKMLSVIPIPHLYVIYCFYLYKTWTNMSCLILQKNTGVLAILDEECMFPKATDKSLATKLHQVTGRKERRKEGRREGNNLFNNAIKHILFTVILQTYGRTTQIAREETRFHHMGYSFWIWQTREVLWGQLLGIGWVRLCLESTVSLSLLCNQCLESRCIVVKQQGCG